LPALSPVRRWNHHQPSASASLVVEAADSSDRFVVPGSLSASCVHEYEKPSTALDVSEAPVQVASTVLSFDQSPSMWLADSVGLPGAVVSMRNGPRWVGALQLPALSRVRRWNHHSPSVSDGLVAPVAVSSASFVVSGSLVASGVHEYEKPSTPLPESEAPLHVTSTVLSFDQPGPCELVSRGSPGGERSGAPWQFSKPLSVNVWPSIARNCQLYPRSPRTSLRTPHVAASRISLFAASGVRKERSGAPPVPTTNCRKP
jgi:hypothetical protein